MIEFEPLRHEHLPLLREWLEREHVRRWWRDPIEESLRDHAAAIDGSEPDEHYLIVVDGRPVGLIQTYLASDDPEWDAIIEVGEGVAGVDLFIGDEELTGRGLGAQVLEQFAREVVFGRPDTNALWDAIEKALRLDQSDPAG